MIEWTGVYAVRFKPWILSEALVLMAIGAISILFHLLGVFLVLGP